MKHICIWLVRFYRRFLSPLKGGACCRFTPTCSAYAIEAFEKRGFFVGLILTVWRILRCNPYCAGGYDPVPEKGFRYKGSREIPDTCACCENGSNARENEENAFTCEATGNTSDEASIHGKEKNL